jgi:hypothetical protein
MMHLIDVQKLTTVTVVEEIYRRSGDKKSSPAMLPVSAPMSNRQKTTYDR